MQARCETHRDKRNPQTRASVRRRKISLGQTVAAISGQYWRGLIRKTGVSKFKIGCELSQLSSFREGTQRPLTSRRIFRAQLPKINCLQISNVKKASVLCFAHSDHFEVQAISSHIRKADESTGARKPSMRSSG
jgi:hypothetical protein